MGVGHVEVHSWRACLRAVGVFEPDFACGRLLCGEVNAAIDDSGWKGVPKSMPTVVVCHGCDTDPMTGDPGLSQGESAGDDFCGSWHCSWDYSGNLSGVDDSGIEAVRPELWLVGGGSLRALKGLAAIRAARVARGAKFVDEVAPGFGGASAGSGQVVRTLQTGGNKMLKQTAKALNDALGKSVVRRDWGRALEDLKRELGLPNDHHGRILSTGEYVDDQGIVLGRLQDYLR